MRLYKVTNIAMMIGGAVFVGIVVGHLETLVNCWKLYPLSDPLIDESLMEIYATLNQTLLVGIIYWTVLFIVVFLLGMFMMYLGLTRLYKACLFKVIDGGTIHEK